MIDSEKNLFRYFLKDSIRKEIDFSRTDQSLGIEAPPVVKPFPDGTHFVHLPGPDEWGDRGMLPFLQIVNARKSRRKFSGKPFTLSDLSFLLWTTQGIRKIINNRTSLRSVPSAGARHALETYLVIGKVNGLECGLYRYDPINGRLGLIKVDDHASESLAEACWNQSFIAEAAATFIWTTIPYRMEWRYDLAAHRVIAIDSGHVCQNLYLACEAIGAGTCGVAAYDQDAVDRFLGVDGDDEFTIYLAPTGNIPS